MFIMSYLSTISSKCHVLSTVIFFLVMSCPLSCPSCQVLSAIIFILYSSCLISSHVCDNVMSYNLMCSLSSMPMFIMSRLFSCQAHLSVMSCVLWNSLSCSASDMSCHMVGPLCQLPCPPSDHLSESHVHLSDFLCLVVRFVLSRFILWCLVNIICHAIIPSGWIQKSFLSFHVLSSLANLLCCSTFRCSFLHCIWIKNSLVLFY